MATAPTPLGSWKFTRAEVARCCLKYGPFLKLDGIKGPVGEVLDPVLFMWAFALNESIHEGPDILSCPPRFEKAYWEGGRYADPNNYRCRYQIELNVRFGKDGAKSYGNWQVMLCNTGYKPEEFIRCEAGAEAFLGHMNRAIAAQKPPTLRDVADMYNSGNWRDKFDVPAYTQRLMANYAVPMPEIWNPQ